MNQPAIQESQDQDLAAFLGSIVDAYQSKEEVIHHRILNSLGLTCAEQDAVRKYIPPNAKILDIGCGTGREAFEIARQRSDVNIDCLDISEPMLEEAKQYCKDYSSRINFLPPANAVGFLSRYDKDDKYDAVLLFNLVLSHIPKYENRLRVLKEAKRAKKENAPIIMEVDSTSRMNWNCFMTHFLLNENDQMEWGDKFVGPSEYKISSDNVYLHSFNRKELRKIVKEAGLRRIRKYNPLFFIDDFLKGSQPLYVLK